jgi:hypothetical protein
MEYSQFQKQWIDIASRYNLELDIPYSLNLSSGRTITVEIRLKGYGHTNGMLLVTDYNIIQNDADEIVDLGYGFSCLSEPSGNEMISDEEIVELLNDWGKN